MLRLRDIQKSWIVLIYSGVLISSFTLPACQELEPGVDPYLVTVSVTTTDEGSYELKGWVLNVGINVILDHGFCWSELPDPTQIDETFQIGTKNSTGSFYGTVNDLLGNSTYYFRAFARTRDGTFFGNQIRFQTPQPALPILSTKLITDLTGTSLQSGGEVVFSGGAPVSNRGVCWSISPNPTYADDHTNDGAGTGDFTSFVTGLLPDTDYYLRAYATNTIGTGYGDEMVFRTLHGSFTDIDGNNYGTVIIGSQTWMGSNLKVTHYAEFDNE